LVISTSAFGTPALMSAINLIINSRPRRRSSCRGEIDDHGHVLVATPGVAPHVLVDADDLHAVEPRGILDRHALALGQDSVVRGIPSDPEAFGDPGDGQVLDHDPNRRGG
jgi:hypothetical protein